LNLTTNAHGFMNVIADMFQPRMWDL